VSIRPIRVVVSSIFQAGSMGHRMAIPRLRWGTTQSISRLTITFSGPRRRTIAVFLNAHGSAMHMPVIQTGF
jgi:hypothetical protein